MKNYTWVKAFLAVLLLGCFVLTGCATTEERQARKKAQIDELQKKFAWWPTDAKPEPVKDDKRSGYWWWPSKPGQAAIWGNRGYVYVNKIIFDYKSDELGPAQPKEKRPSLLIKKIIKNVKVYFDFDKSSLRSDAKNILEDAVKVLNKNPQADILVTGNADMRGSEKYNDKLGRKRADAVKSFMIDNGIEEERVRIISRGKLDAVAPITDLVGMQKDRNAQFMIAEVEEMMLATPEGAQVAAPEGATIEEGKYVQEVEKEVESAVKVSTREYKVREGDSLWKIAEREMGKGHRWEYLYEINKDRIKNPKKLKVGQVLIIPVE